MRTLSLFVLSYVIFISVSANAHVQVFEDVRELSCDGLLDLEIFQGNENKLETPSNDLEVSINERALGLFSTNQSSPVKAVLTLKNLEKITLSGGAKVDIDIMDTERFMIVLEKGLPSLIEGTFLVQDLVTNIYGSAKASLRGIAKTHTLFAPNSGSYLIEDLKTERLKVVNAQGE